MHELSLTQGVVEAITDRLGPRRVVMVRLEIGKLSGVVVDSVRFCFDLVVAGTPLEGARLEIEEPGGRARCRDCSASFASDDPILLCPCGSSDVEVLAGTELLIKAVQLAPGEVLPDVRDVRV
ncbi:hydrogenase maturation nickel metallochaperone HypA [Kutzneria kofuensis]|uniref:Hydrogenase maturation factor HypA n=1 Tax=Kutzneria kofuensis TaxID=103725 RepID=A0A7W9KS60_9PSEU|nr:hydrogenase maturation nickel metallochaperone HypA [Kutzneria kofuensis]MBB5897642.1 hydrogenase nickel incorporation protein HypA/HybF [Kutzneria kofuensis]